MFGKIISVEKDSLADEIELKPGDSILEVNGKKIRDIIELSFELADEKIEMLIEHADGNRELIEFEKDIDEELGAEFESAVFDGIQRCKNNCYFCFVNMIDPAMRKSLTIKDDDYRLSFLYGNFITLSNLTERDYRRIEKFHLSPLFVSIHTMNSKLRSEMLRCKVAGKIHEQLDRLEKAGVEYHTQIVLCRNLNDGRFLEQTLEELINRYPKVLSIAIVPVGITKFRRDPFPIEQFDKNSAREVIKQIEPWQHKFDMLGKTFVYLADEFYLLADQEIPHAAMYDDFPQLDNGIGLTRSFIDDFEYSKSLPRYKSKTRIGVVSGTSIAPVLKRLADEISNPNLQVKSIPVVNESFGSTVNVSGLLTGKDIFENLTLEKDLDCVLIPASALRIDTFLDDMKLETLQNFFPDTRILPISNGKEFRRALCDFKTFKVYTDSKNYMWQSNAGYVR